uniref:Uncharacterized protein n=1 Tax=Chromera velia CCMP2878 TaxID=1169474 RepID=A0A0G4IFG8_9ALVE|mmetsp:Transcript_39878/g.78633  ORF Transcript_39878/g.78633 Transcript_39878/m.78633 type:complete len:146 (+) Transcript_39878:128-565(+)|eukprot:Cvel_13978.t1-p1 / transcript=Cvel_13978.t1 / gene=Cvel_13978 / organism=Chromera_velia_CCMP2878 / gene_product=hypothetical protein / transcript_product=hypothetical protein / location=Cvel_scaffold977:22157-24099(+) / protein_length=145 / sequence_SO=supercontig / SO=protein_coding / is_pseudo=false
MGSCLGSLGGPKIDIPSEETVKGLLDDQIAGPLGDAKDKYDEINDEVEKLEDGQEYEVPGTSIKLKKDATVQEKKKAAFAVAFGDDKKQKIKEETWEKIEGEHIKPNVENYDSLPAMTKTPVKSSVEKMMDKAFGEVEQKFVSEA